jgi:hypothetical protein
MSSLMKICLAAALAAMVAAPVEARTGARYLEGYAGPPEDYAYGPAYGPYGRFGHYGAPTRITCDPEKDGPSCEFRRRR